jgi:hypothetical protein
MLETKRKTWAPFMVVLILAGLGMVVAEASASPAINSAIINTRIWNDDSNSVITFGNNYPTSLWIKDDQLDGDGEGGEWANRHNFRLSENGFIAADFDNDDGFVFFTDVTVSGPANSEGGINLSPWWSQDVDGTFTVITNSGEIAAFGGRLPYYSFNNHEPAVTYTKGETVRLGVKYFPNDLSEENPGTIEYVVIKNSVRYTSGRIAFDMGTESEGYGTWGILDDSRVGGYFMPQIVEGDSSNWGRIDYGNMFYVPEPASLALLLLGGLTVMRRRGR